MSKTISKLTHQINLSNSLEIKENFYGPTFSTDNNVFWQLSLHPGDDYYGIFLQPIAGPDEIIWGERSKLSFTLFAKEVRNNRAFELCTYYDTIAPSYTEISSDYGYKEAFKKSVLQDGELIIGVRFNDIEYEEKKICRDPKPIPKNLINAWKNQLFDFQPVDVKFSVQGERFYASSSILSKRSEYFAKILSGESAVIQNKEIILDIGAGISKLLSALFSGLLFLVWLSKGQIDNFIVGKVDDSVVEKSMIPLNDNNFTNNDDKSKFHIKYHIEVSDYDPITFSTMLEYLYTNQINWANGDEKSIITTNLFCLADKYSLSDLRERAKIRILDELKVSNVSGIMFGLAQDYEDLKDPVLKFMVKNFEKVSNTQEFKGILSSLANYPNYNIVLTEILAEHFKIQKIK